ncbi:MAG: hypothetical protein ACRDLB_04385 [Actinomycetota bacterium]
MQLQRIERTLRRFLIEVARQNRTTTYTEMARVLRPFTPVRLEPPYSPMHTWLGNISRFEHEADRALLSAVVVRADSGRPGIGFFHLASNYLGFTFEDEDLFWNEQREGLYAFWGSGENSLVASHDVELSDGRVVKIKEYVTGSVRMVLDDAPYALTQAYITSGKHDQAMIRLEPFDWWGGAQPKLLDK